MSLCSDAQRIRRFPCLQDCLLTLTCHLASSGSDTFSSQLFPIHSPLISSIVDFVCSSYQVHKQLIFDRLESPTVWTVTSFSGEVVLWPTLVCHCQSPQIGCVFDSVNNVNYVNCVNILYFFPPGSVVHRQFFVFSDSTYVWSSHLLEDTSCS